MIKSEYLKHKSKIPMFAGIGLVVLLALWVVSRFDEPKKEAADGKQN
jgi:hypothetical protein